VHVPAGVVRGVGDLSMVVRVEGSVAAVMGVVGVVEAVLRRVRVAHFSRFTRGSSAQNPHLQL